MAYVQRACKNFQALRTGQPTTSGPLTPDERYRAMVKLVTMDQAKNMTKEFHRALDSRTEGSQGKNGTIFLDQNCGLLRYYGRVQSDNLDMDERYPMLLSPKGHLARLYLEDAHKKTLHGGTQQILQMVRQNFWIPQARRQAKKVVHRCYRCFRYQAKERTQLMAQLPTTRTTLAKPFTNCGVDYLGPIGVMSRPGRNPTITKGYICVFVCFATRAIHLELAGDATTATFIAALRRMIARRGRIQRIHSDNGTNFVGAKNVLQAIYQTSEWAATTQQIEWKFQPPLSPHHGGLHEAAVKSVKHHLKRAIGTSNLTVEELFTLTAQIEASVNSRPLTVLSDDPTDLTALTPGHFLIGENLVTLIEPRPLLELNESSLTRWERTQQKYQEVWKRWHEEYLTELIKRQKWPTIEENIKRGTMVLIREDNAPPTKWSLARVKETFPARDGLVRVVNLQTSKGEYTRPITKLAVLPAQQDYDQEENKNQ